MADQNLDDEFKRAFIASERRKRWFTRCVVAFIIIGGVLYYLAGVVNRTASLGREAQQMDTSDNTQVPVGPDAPPGSDATANQGQTSQNVGAVPEKPIPDPTPEEQQTAVSLQRDLSDKEYPEARAILIGRGWTPVTLADSENCHEHLECRLEFPEMESCSGDGWCRYSWRAGEVLILVITHDNAPDPDTVADVRACALSDRC